MNHIEKIKHRLRVKPIHNFHKQILDNFYLWKSDLSKKIDNNELKKKILDYKQKYPESNKSNLSAWNSGYHTHLQTSTFNDFITILENEVQTCVKGILDHSDNTLKLAHFWAAIYELNDFAKLHNHGICNYSAVYYVDADESTSSLIFEDEFEIIPYPGLLVIFSGQYFHKVPKMTSSKNRTILAANFMYIPNYFLSNNKQ